MTTGNRITIKTTGIINKPSGNSIFTEKLIACVAGRLDTER
jgi:hypothetical protein